MDPTQPKPTHGSTQPMDNSVPAVDILHLVRKGQQRCGVYFGGVCDWDGAVGGGSQEAAAGSTTLGRWSSSSSMSRRRWRRAAAAADQEQVVSSRQRHSRQRLRLAVRRTMSPSSPPPPSQCLSRVARTTATYRRSASIRWYWTRYKAAVC